ncbi:helix-turn-helix transcriptional regulator [Spirosoma fluminis]
MNRLDRLTAILIHLQTKRVVRAQELADRFGISLRTVYRDVRSLETAGVPIGAEAGVGYFLTDYHLPPVMFTNTEASALLLGGKLIEKWADESVRREFESALFKVKSVLKRTDQEYLDDLAPNLDVSAPAGQPVYANSLLKDIQHAIGQHQVLRLHYYSAYSEAETQRDVEPIGLYHYGMAWHLIAFCHTRQDYRDFRVDRIRELFNTGQRFARHERLTLQQYLDRMGNDMPSIAVTVVFEKKVCPYIQQQRILYGFQSEEITGDYVRMNFLTPYIQGLARWLLMYGKTVTIEQPDMLIGLVQNLTEELRDHYLLEPSVLP